MPIVVNLDVMMARRHKGAGELAEEIGITPANLSILKNNKAKAVRFSTLEALCRALDCQPGGYSGVCAGRESVGAGHARPAAFPQANVCFRQHRIIPALRLKHRSGGCGTASALPKCSIIHKVLSALLA